MHPVVYREFERICLKRNITGSVLEIGATPSSKSLLCMNSLKNASSKVGINLKGPGSFRDFEIKKGNANAMDCFENEKFDVVLCNAVLEHDKYFWKTIDEIKRVTKPGGLIVIGTPGFTNHKSERFKFFLRKIPLVNKLRTNPHVNFLFEGTMTLEIHSAPHDYYRFSRQAFIEVFLKDLDNIEIREIMSPVRIIGAGTKRDSRH